MRTLCAFLIVLFVVPAASAQEYGVSGTVSALVPIGGLAERFKPAAGGSVTFSLHRGSPEWSGSLDYFKFTQENSDELSVTRTVADSISGTEAAYTFPLTKLEMSLEVWGASATASWGLFMLGPVDTRLSLSAGFYRWKSVRGAYEDSLYVDIDGRQVLAEVLDVPESRQEDWSGGFAVGLDFVLPVVDPVFITAGARYRIVVGELWPSLALDLENVSSFQMLDLRAGVEVRW